MPGTSKAAQTLFDLSGGHPALDLVNSLDNRFRADGPNEMLASYDDLLRFLEESGLLSRQRGLILSKVVTPDAAQRALLATRELREATAAVCYAAVQGRTPAPADIQILEIHLHNASRHRELQWTPEAHPTGYSNTHAGALAWHWGRSESEPDLPQWILSQSVSELLLSDDMAHLRTCAVDTCRWLFLDTSKNHSRRWCNMKVCGNRMKARRFQARREG